MLISSRTCSIDGCTQTHRGKGYCAFHYNKWYRHGDPLWERQKLPGTWESRNPEKKRESDREYAQRVKADADLLERRRKSAREWGQRNRSAVTRNSSKYQRRKRAFIDAYKQMLGCADCGYDLHHAALVDHVHGVKTTKGQGRAFLLSWVGMRDELEKCEVRCSNCHRIRTAENWLRYSHPAGELGRAESS